MVAAAEHGPYAAAHPMPALRMTAAVPHEPHEVDDAGHLLAHLVARHDYSAEQIAHGSKSFLTTLHVRAHERMAETAAGRTVPELAGSAERLFATALDTAEALLPQDPELARRIAGRWVEALAAFVR